jgi:hypothetical protein
MPVLELTGILHFETHCKAVNVFILVCFVVLNFQYLVQICFLVFTTGGQLVYKACAIGTRTS